MTQTLAFARTVASVMTHRPVSVPGDTPFHTFAALLASRRIAAVPVTGRDGRLVGVVSERDLIRAGLRRGGDLGALTARELMTTSLVIVGMDDSVPAAARRLTDAGVRRLYVVEDGRLVGVLSRRDLLHSYLRDDDEIRTEVERDVLASLSGEQVVVRASVADGVVLLVGRVEWRSRLAGIDALVRAVPGVVDVRNRIGYQWDDGTGPTARSGR